MDEVIPIIAAQVELANWQTSEKDCYHIIYLFGCTSWRQFDSDNVLKTTNDCLLRGKWTRKKNQKTGLYEPRWRSGGNAVWDDKPILDKTITKSGRFERWLDGRPMTRIIITKIADPDAPEPKTTKKRKPKKKEVIPPHDTDTTATTTAAHARTLSISYPAH